MMDTILIVAMVTALLGVGSFWGGYALGHEIGVRKGWSIGYAQAFDFSQQQNDQALDK